MVGIGVVLFTSIVREQVNALHYGRHAERISNTINGYLKGRQRFIQRRAGQPRPYQVSWDNSPRSRSPQPPVNLIFSGPGQVRRDADCACCLCLNSPRHNNRIKGHRCITTEGCGVRTPIPIQSYKRTIKWIYKWRAKHYSNPIPNALPLLAGLEILYVPRKGILLLLLSTSKT